MLGNWFNFRKYSLNSKDLVFTDQWSSFGSFNPIMAPIDQFIQDDLIVDGSLELLWLDKESISQHRQTE